MTWSSPRTSGRAAAAAATGRAAAVSGTTQRELQPLDTFRAHAVQLVRRVTGGASGGDGSGGEQPGPSPIADRYLPLEPPREPPLPPRPAPDGRGLELATTAATTLPQRGGGGPLDACMTEGVLAVCGLLRAALPASAAGAAGAAPAGGAGSPRRCGWEPAPTLT